MVGCAGTGTQPNGWSGIYVTDEKVVLGSMKGKIIALNTSDGSRLLEITPETPKASGGFGCAPATSTIAIYGTPVVSQDLIIVCGYLYLGNRSNGKVYAYNSDSGALRWVYPRTGELDSPIVGGPAIADNVLYFGTAGGKVYALDVATGDYKWDVQLDGDIWSTPTIKDNTLFIGTFGKKLFALNTSNGQQKWAPFTSGGALASSLLLQDTTLYFGTLDRRLHAVDSKSGMQKWKSEVEAGSWFWAKPVITNDVVYAPCLDGKVYAVDADNGNLRFEFDLKAPISSSPVLVGNSLIVATKEGKVYTINTERNQENFLADLQELAGVELEVNSPLSASNGAVFIHVQTDKYGSRVYTLNADTGALVWQYLSSSDK